MHGAVRDTHVDKTTIVLLIVQRVVLQTHGRAVVSMACKVVSIVSSKMTSCENIASSPTTTTLMTVTRLATQSVSWVVNDVRTF